ncbi:MAG: hypothetical protein NZ879_01170 [Archaeoglobaceae archaeon]|nr:hypothetical protein [Archaeoglobaceae archaeon]MDW8117574.1 hypothetical protein [Archaeoglobaceae archaeon]
MRENMSVSCFDRDGLRAFEELLSLVERYCEEGIIPLNELDEEKMLKLDFFRLAVPRRSSNDSLAWKMRQFGSEMEIPYVVRFYFRKGKDPEKAIFEYFKEIGEKAPEEFIEIFREILERAKDLIVCGEEIVDIAMKYKREPGALISELKGSGLISPTVGCGSLGKAKAPLYEINRFFAILLKSED